MKDELQGKVVSVESMNKNLLSPSQSICARAVRGELISRDSTVQPLYTFHFESPYNLARLWLRIYQKGLKTGGANTYSGLYATYFEVSGLITADRKERTDRE